VIYCVSAVARFSNRLRPLHKDFLSATRCPVCGGALPTNEMLAAAGTAARHQLHRATDAMRAGRLPG
jgi:hypothetical protein